MPSYSIGKGGYYNMEVACIIARELFIYNYC